RLGGATLAAMASESAAAGLASALRAIAGGKPKERTRRIDELLAARLDAARARRRVAAFRRAAWPLLASENLLFLLIFAGGPLVIFTELSAWWPGVVGGALLAWAASLATFALARRRCFPAGGGLDGPPLSRRLSSALWPIAAMRGSDLLGRFLLADL